MDLAHDPPPSVRRLAVFYRVENWRGRRAFAAVAREAASAGVSFSLRDYYASPPVPGALDLAKHPLFTPPAAGEPDKFWWDLSDRFKPRCEPTGTDFFPSDGAPSPFENLPADPASTREAYLRLIEKHGTEALDLYLNRTAPLLDEFGTAVAERPNLRYDYDWEKLYSIPLPHIAALRAIGSSACDHALFELEKHRPDVAARRLLLTLRLRSALDPAPFLVTQHTSTWLDARACSHIWQGQRKHQWAGPELASFSEVLAKEQILAGFRGAFTAETALGVSFCLQLAESRPAALDMLRGWEPLVAPLGQFFAWVPSGWAYQNAARLGYVALQEILPSIDVAAGRIRLDTVQPPEPDPTSFAPYRLIARVLQPAFGNAVKTAGRTKTIHDLARLAVALEQQLLAHGAYPESLAPVLAADPALAALHDPFTGEPYRYRREADGGFTLWGAGQNARDDGAAVPSSNGSRPDYGTGDLVWHVPGRAAREGAASN